MFRVRSVPAALYKALGGFATNGVNMTKLESYIIDGSFTVADAILGDTERARGNWGEAQYVFAEIPEARLPWERVLRGLVAKALTQAAAAARPGSVSTTSSPSGAPVSSVVRARRAMTAPLASLCTAAPFMFPSCRRREPR